jgi:hypothetical protein
MFKATLVNGVFINHKYVHKYVERYSPDVLCFDEC